MIDNTSDKYWGIKGKFKVIADVTNTDDEITLYIEESDENGNWPSDEADFEITESMVRYFIKKVHNRKMFVRPRIVIGIPSGITEVEKRAVRGIIGEVTGYKTIKMKVGYKKSKKDVIR